MAHAYREGMLASIDFIEKERQRTPDKRFFVALHRDASKAY